MLLSLPRRAKAPVAVALAAAWIAAAVSPARAGQVRALEWWLESLHVTRAWATSEGSRITVALLDTGVDPAAPDLRSRVTTGPDFTGSRRHSGGPLWGIHGTAMASLAAGHGHGPGDGEGVVGVAPQAKILSMRVIMESSDPLQSDLPIASRQPTAIAAGIRYAADHGAQVTDLPLDPAGRAAAGGSPAEQAAVAYALAKGVALVAPAGDDGTRADRVNYPAAYPGVISVGAFDRNIIKAPFTNHRAYVTLTSAGAGVAAATPSGGYATFNSTSAASAMVAGMAALIKSRYPAFTPAQVTEALTHSTVFHPPGGKSDGSGYGTADAARALVLAAAIQSAAFPKPPSPGHASAAGAAQAAIPPAGPGLGATLLNDVILLFLLLLAVLLAMSIVAVIRTAGSSATLHDEDVGDAADMMPHFTSEYSAGPAGQRSYADAASRVPPSQPGAGPPMPGVTARAGQAGYPGSSAPGPMPWEGTIRPPNVPGGPPWGPAPKPKGEPPPPSQRPRRS